jgi:hypothetical protein
LETVAERPFMKEFYLAGGTGLAVQLGHRISVDLDFFTRTSELDGPDRRRILKQLAPIKGFSLIEEREGTLHFALSSTRVSLLHYPYRLQRPLRRWKAVRVASPLDIGMMKIGAVIGRGSKKDFVDLYFIAEQVCSLETLLKQAGRKFQRASDLRMQALKAMIYFEDAETERMPKMLEPVSWPAVRSFFEKEVRAITARVLR